MNTAPTANPPGVGRVAADALVAAATPTPFDPLDPPTVVAAALGLSVQTLANWRCTGAVELDFVKIGRNVRYPRSKWQALAATGTQGA